MDEVVVEVAGLALAKGEALSMLGARHSHRPRVEALLEAATNLLGGVADVLQSDRRGAIDLTHLGDSIGWVRLNCGEWASEYCW